MGIGMDLPWHRRQAETLDGRVERIGTVAMLQARVHELEEFVSSVATDTPRPDCDCLPCRAAVVLGRK